ncbi:MAG: extracellular matrix regulator RemB [Acetanaerobacterium sp.]
MYLHLGQDTVVRLSDIVGIFDLENATISKHTRAYLAAAEKGGRVVNVSDEMPKSFCVCRHGKNTRVYISQISSATLKRRSGFIESIANV